MIPAPTWIDPEVWEAFVEMRAAKGKRAPFTDRAAKMLINELDRLRGAGHNPDEVLKQSVMNGWSGVFPLKHLGSPFGGNSAQQPTFRPSNEWLEKHREHMSAPVDQEKADVALQRMAAIKERLKGRV